MGTVRHLLTVCVGRMIVGITLRWAWMLFRLSLAFVPSCIFRTLLARVVNLIDLLLSARPDFVTVLISCLTSCRYTWGGSGFRAGISLITIGGRSWCVSVWCLPFLPMSEPYECVANKCPRNFMWTLIYEWLIGVWRDTFQGRRSLILLTGWSAMRSRTWWR
jgi:hypothetical protein